MDSFLSILFISAQLASIYGMVVLAVVLAFRIANFADLTMDGSFTLGAAVGAESLVRGVHPVLALFYGTLAGALAGVVTALLHSRVKVNRLLSGIITMTILYSVNLRIMGRSNVSFLNESSLFSAFGSENFQLFASIVFVLLISGFIWFFLRTDLGYFLRAAGENPRVVIRRGFSEEIFIIISLFVANGVAALAGGLAAQHQGFADIGMGTGVVIASLTSLLLGETLLPPRSILRLLLAALAGAFVYQMIIAVGLRLGINPWDMKLATGFLLVGALVLKHRFHSRRSAENIGSDPL